MPKRIQRKRTKGWRMPENAVVVSRPSRFGNPFIAGVNAEAVDKLRAWLDETPEGRAVKERARAELRGKDLACFCSLDSLMLSACFVRADGGKSMNRIGLEIDLFETCMPRNRGSRR